MNNNDAIWYLIKTKVKARIRNILKSPILLIVTIVLIGLTGLNIFNSMQQQASLMPEFIMDTALLNIIGGLVLFIMLIVFVFSQKSALIYENDAIFLFTSPFTNKQTYTYLLLITLQQSIMFGFGYVFYMLIFFHSLINGPLHMLGIILSVFLHFLVVTLYFNSEYIKNAVKSEIARINRIPLLIISMLIIGLFLYTLNFDFTIDGVKNTIHHPIFKYIPFIGTFGWISNAFYLKDFSVIIPILAILVICVFLTIRMYSIEGNFTEKALQDAQYASSIMRDAKAGKSIDSIDSKKIKNRKVKSGFLSGAWAFLSKEFLIMRKTRRYFPLGMLIFGGIYSVIAFFINDLETYKLLLIFSLVFGNESSELLMQELQKPYIYLVPDSEFKKVLSTLIIPLLRVTLLLIVYGIILVILGESILNAIIFCLFALTVYLIFLGVDLYIYRLLRSKSNMLVKMYVNLFFYLIALIPAGVTILILLFVMNIFDLNTLLIAAGIVNVIVSILLINYSKTILMGNNLSA